MNEEEYFRVLLKCAHNLLAQAPIKDDTWSRDAIILEAQIRNFLKKENPK